MKAIRVVVKKLSHCPVCDEDIIARVEVELDEQQALFATSTVDQMMSILAQGENIPKMVNLRGEVKRIIVQHDCGAVELEVNIITDWRAEHPGWSRVSCQGPPECNIVEVHEHWKDTEGNDWQFLQGYHPSELSSVEYFRAVDHTDIPLAQRVPGWERVFPQEDSCTETTPHEHWTSPSGQYWVYQAGQGPDSLQASGHLDGSGVKYADSLQHICGATKIAEPTSKLVCTFEPHDVGTPHSWGLEPYKSDNSD